ncbi:MAG: hypothetical protein JKX98_04930 [Alcanivoracaceae bacterium]|nr:hypothetical protein [Alcanivoracaceae bacterium]
MDQIEDPKLRAFSNLIFKSNVRKPDSYSNSTEKSYYTIVCAISEQNKKNFEIEFKNISKRQPTENTPFIHDDFRVL